MPPAIPRRARIFLGFFTVAIMVTTGILVYREQPVLGAALVTLGFIRLLLVRREARRQARFERRRQQLEEDDTADDDSD